MALIPPHGGALVNRVASPKEAEAWRGRLPGLPRLRPKPYELSDLHLLAVGAYSPLDGFMLQEDYRKVLRELHLGNGLVWPMPITLSATAEEARSLREGEAVALEDGEGQGVGILHLEEIFPYSREEEARLVYGTTDPAHPGVARLYQRGESLLGGKVTLLERWHHPLFPQCHLDPEESRQRFQERGWRTVVGFQTRNPVHRAHEFIQKCALQLVDGLFLHPLVGETKDDDIPPEVRMRCYEVLLKNYYPPQRVVLGILPAAMRYAGPREAVFHALVRQNYGCTHFIVGRDHAGVGNYYGPYDAQHIFQRFPGELAITPLFFENAFFCRRCGEITSVKTCPHDKSSWLLFSGTEIRGLLRKGISPPAEFTRPEVAQVLLDSLREG